MVSDPVSSFLSKSRPLDANIPVIIWQINIHVNFVLTFILLPVNKSKRVSTAWQCRARARSKGCTHTYISLLRSYRCRSAVYCSSFVWLEDLWLHLSVLLGFLGSQTLIFKVRSLHQCRQCLQFGVISFRVNIVLLFCLQEAIELSLYVVRLSHRLFWSNIGSNIWKI